LFVVKIPRAERKSNLRSGLIIFSRFDSSRLPGKALVDISGRPLIGRVLDRCRLVSGFDKLLVATSDRAVDDPIAEFAYKENVALFRGDCNDVLGRAVGACQQYEVDTMVRICGDRPFLDPHLVSELLSIHAHSNFDLVTTMCPRTYPPGLTTEIISLKALIRCSKRATDPFDREHLTTYFYRNADDFSIKNIWPPKGKSLDGIKLVVDDAIDLARARFIAEHLSQNPDNYNDMETILFLARQWDRKMLKEPIN
jgi:spore coat polysaccharide biosynthesis protein SpsF (cytidylyltransferase family)